MIPASFQAFFAARLSTSLHSPEQTRRSTALRGAADLEALQEFAAPDPRDPLPERTAGADRWDEGEAIAGVAEPLGEQDHDLHGAVARHLCLPGVPEDAGGFLRGGMDRPGDGARAGVVLLRARGRGGAVESECRDL